MIAAGPQGRRQFFDFLSFRLLSWNVLPAPQTMLFSCLFAAILSLAAGGIQGAEPPPEICVSVLPGGSAAKGPPSSFTWEKQRLELDSPLGQSIVRTSYYFTNTSKNRVSLVDLLPSCGCVTTEVAKIDFDPGERGEIKVTLDLAMDDAQGLQERYILVKTSDAPNTPTVLRLLVHVASGIELSTNALSWKIGDKPLTKEIIVNAAAGVEQLKLSTAFENSDFQVRIKPETAGRSYRVSITPASTAALCYAQIRLLADSTSFPRQVDYKINLNVN